MSGDSSQAVSRGFPRSVSAAFSRRWIPTSMGSQQVKKIPVRFPFDYFSSSAHEGAAAGLGADVMLGGRAARRTPMTLPVLVPPDQKEFVDDGLGRRTPVDPWRVPFPDRPTDT